MNLEGGRCLFAFVILTGFLLGAAYGQNDTTMAPTTTPATTPPMTTTAPAIIDSVTTVLSTTISPTTPVETTNTTTEITDSVMMTKSVMTSFEATTAVQATNTTLVTDSVTMTDFVTSSETTMADIDECSSNPCENNGTCMVGINEYTCNCAGTGFEGTNCDMNIDECSSDPCMNGGTCTDETNGYTCNCTGTGYGGPNCAIDINECNSNPCMNGGTCNNMVNHYTCSCVSGYEGTNCETDIDDCDNHNCTNGGTCNDLVNGYECLCPPGFNGTFCEIDVRECDSMPCDNGGTCYDGTNYYNCTCAPGFNGTYCENKCPPGTFGSYCEDSCTCVAAANCSNVDGSCTCDQEVCDKSELQVIAFRSGDGPISKDESFTLACEVNLVEEDLEEVSWYRDGMKLMSNTKYEIKTDPAMGEYNITIRRAGAEDTGNYTCTAVTAGNQFNDSSDVIEISVVVRGMINLALSKQNDSIQLNEMASLSCTVFSSSDDASIAWERKGERLADGNRTNITEGRQEGTGGMYFFSFLEISGITREDNGIYTCVALNGARNSTDRADFNIFVQEVAELANASYVNVRSEQLSLDWDFIIQGNAELNCNATYTIQGTNQREQQPVGGSPPVVVTNLDPYTYYNFVLTCVNLVGSSEPLNFDIIQTLAGTPSPPRNVRVSNIEARQVFVEWEEPEEPNGPINGYTLTARTGSSTITSPGLVRETRYEFRGLTPATTYDIVVQATNTNTEEGNKISAPSAPSETFTTSEAAPGKPTGFDVDDSGNTCTVTWRAPSEPNGVITRYTLYTEILRRDTMALERGELMQMPSDQFVITWQKSTLDPFSIYRYSLTASTQPGEGLNATAQDNCETPEGVPVKPSPIPAPLDSAISQNSFKTTLQPYDERNGPVSCYEVIVVQLGNVEAGENLDSSDPTYSPSRIKTHEEAKDAKGLPYRAMVFRDPPRNNELVIGATTENVTTCHTGDSPGSGRRRRRETTTAGPLTAVNGPLNTGGIYSSFVRVYTPSTEQSGMVFYESGPFMAPVKLKEYSNTGAIVGAIFGVLIALALVSVILLMLYRRKKDMAGDPLMTPTSNGPRENGNGTLIGMENLGIEDEMVVEPIKLERLEKAIREKAKDEKKVFWDEYKALPNRPPPMVTMNSSNHPANKDKNRYINIIAYDHTRVKLKHVDGIEGSDYINASYVNGYQSPDKFIAAQGPKDNTLEDFWRMIWECNCSTIVMLTKCVEDGKDKCSQYWPNTGSVKYGRFEVKLDEVKETAEYVIRSFFLSENDKETGQRSITQFHFLGWPDHGQPDYPNPMLCLIKRVRHLTSKMNHRANIVVHCSAGVGRTGTYIVIDAMLDKMKHEKQVDIYNFIHEIRQQRNTLVQSFVQYFFIHIALLEEHLFGHMDVGMSDFPAYYQQLSNKSDYNEDLTRLEEEFRRACKLGVNGTEQTYANIDQNKDKNRIGHILPFDKNIVKLERLIGEEFSDYINASYITGYDRKNMYIATQGPLPNTIADFWRMIWESQTSTIVMLTETTEKGHEMCAQYWPLEVDEVEEHGNISVTLIDESDEDEAFTVRDIEISHAQVMQNIYGNIDKEGEGPTEAADSPEGESAYGNVPDSPPPTPMKDIRKIRQYHFRGWPEVGVPDTGIDLMRLVNKSHLHQKERGAHPIVVHCSAGAGRTGVFIGLNILMSRMEEESMIDVFQTVRGLRQQRPHMVQDLAQYKFCYLAMVEYIQDQSTEYQNFVPRV